MLDASASVGANGDAGACAMRARVRCRQRRRRLVPTHVLAGSAQQPRQTLRQKNAQRVLPPAASGACRRRLLLSIVMSGFHQPVCLLRSTLCHLPLEREGFIYFEFETGLRISNSPATTSACFVLYTSASDCAKMCEYLHSNSCPKTSHLRGNVIRCSCETR